MAVLLNVIANGQEFSIQRFGLNDGLPQSEISTVFEDSRGALWVGTAAGGVARYNGQRFDVMHRSHGLPGNEVRAITETLSGELLFGTDGGAIAYDGLRLRALPGGLEKASVYAIHRKADGSILVGAEDSLYHLSDDLSPIRASETPDPLVDFTDYGSQTYACGYQGLYTVSCTDGLVFQTISSSGMLRAEQLFVSGTYGLTVVTFGSGAWHYDTTAKKLEPLAIGLPKLLHDGIDLPDGRTAFATHERGIFIHPAQSGESPTVLDTENGLPRNNIRCLLTDRWGNLWAGSTGSGLLQITRRPFEHLTYRRPGGQNPEPIYAIAGDDSLLYLATGDEGIGVFKQFKKVNNAVLSGLQTKSKTLLLDRQNRLWIGTENNGVFVYDGQRLVHIDGDDGLSGSFVRGIAEDPAGRMWIATLGGGITRIEEGLNSQGEQRFMTTLYNRRTGLADDRITCILADETGGIWYGTGNGQLGFIDGATGAVSNTLLSQSDPVQSIVRDRNNRIWAACASGSVWMSTGSGATTRLELPQERPYTLYAIGCDFDGHLWLGGADGAYRYTLNDDGSVRAVDRYTENDGFESLEVCSNAIYVTPSGTVCIGALEGLSLYRRNAERSSGDERAPVARIARPQLAYQPFETLPLRHFIGPWHTPADTLVLTYTQNNLSFEVEAIQLKYPQNLSYSYWMEGLGEGWSPPSNRNFISFSNLAPGHYTLHARVCVKGDACSETKPIAVVILRPYWMTTRFRNAVVAAVVLVLLSVFGLALYVVRRRAQQRNERLRLERDMLELEQRALRLQMNPHFIFNTLNAIQGLIAKEDSRSARQSLSRFSKLMREILQNSREERIPLEEEFDTLEHYLELARFTHENRFNYVLDCSEEAAQCQVPPLILQPFVENAILHGLVPVGGGEVKVSARLIDHQRLRLTVEDNGIGMAAAARAKSSDNHRSAGLSVTTDRLQLFGKNKLWFEEPETGGTRVVIELFVVENQVS